MTSGIHGHAKVGQTNANIEELHADLEEANATLGDISDTDELVLAKLTATGVTTSDIASNTATANAHLAYLEVTGDGTNTRLTSTNTKLDTANGLLADIKTQGIAVNVNTDTLESLSTSGNTNTAGIRTDLATELAKLEQIRAAIVGTLSVTGSVSVSNFPATQAISAAALPLPPGAATAANQATTATGITQLHTDNGNEGSAPPALNGVGAAGVLGYLRNQLDKLTTIASQMTSGVQQTKLGDGTNTATLVSGDTRGLSGAFVQKAINFTSTSTGAQEISSIDCLGYEWAYIFVANGGTGSNVVAQISDDGSTNWGAAPQFDPSALSVAPITFTALQSGGAGYIVPLARRWFRLHCTALTSGTFSGTITLHTSPLPALPGYRSPVTPAAGGFVVDTELASASSASDGFGNPNTAAVVAVNEGFNGTTWDRLRSGVQLLGTSTGRQVVAANAAPATSLAAASTVVAGTTLDSGTSFSKWGMQVTLAGTSPTATVVLEGSLDSTTFTTLATWTSGTQTSGDTIWVQDKLVRYVRARTTAIGGTTPTVTALIVGGAG